MVVLPWEQQKDALRILVVGDLILDEYLEGEVSRISPEAPVPVHMVTRNTVTAGGAANVALNIQQAGGAAAVAGVLGDDHEQVVVEAPSVVGRELAPLPVDRAGREGQSAARDPHLRRHHNGRRADGCRTTDGPQDQNYFK